MIQKGRLTLFLAYKLIPFIASGGKRPYTWLLNGRPLRVKSWQPKFAWALQEGFYTVTVIDAEGNDTRAHIEVK